MAHIILPLGGHENLYIAWKQCMLLHIFRYVVSATYTIIIR